MSWIGLPEFADDTITDYTRPSPNIESNPNDLQNNSSSIFENRESTSSILSKPEIKFVKAVDSPTLMKTNKDETIKKPSIRYAKMYRKTSKSSNVQVSTAELENKGKAVKALPYWIWKPRQNSTDKGINSNSISVIFKKYQYIDTLYVQGNSQNNIDDKGYVSFGQGGCKITGKGTIKTGKLEFENVYFVKDLKYNLFSVSQICDNKNSVLFTDSECIVLGQNFKLKYDTNVFLRTPRQHNMYSIDLNNVVPHKDLTCLVAKASADECMLWRHLNFKTMNKLVRHNLVRGLPSKCFENDHTCVTCLKGKQHKASCKTKLVNSVTKPLHTLHMDLFGPTSDETSGILRNFITEKENLKDLKNGVAKRRNKTLIEAARTMLADAKLSVTFWAEAVNTACYV
nr:putative ribonuclease H-like domain-containing protein [Tanacetum cinerariifolium]GFB15912.1 putative ribonuclease H-like domain-containing protein [Tanacetum cinerariifolium]